MKSLTNCIFLDLDNALINSFFPTDVIDESKCFQVDISNGETYFTVVRKGAQEVIDFAHNLVGAENVFILTNSIREYALQINEKAGFGFLPQNVIARENYCVAIRGAYGSVYPIHKNWSKNNVLVDDLEYEWNATKNDFIGNIPKENYFKCRAFHGVDFPNENFADKVIDFLKEKHNIAERKNKSY